MIDPGMITEGVSIAKSILQFAEWLKKLADTSVISAYFDSEGKRIAGSDKINVLRHEDARETAKASRERAYPLVEDGN